MWWGKEEAKAGQFAKVATGNPLLMMGSNLTARMDEPRLPWLRVQPSSRPETQASNLTFLIIFNNVSAVCRSS